MATHTPADLHVIVRTVTDTPELVGAFTSGEQAGATAEQLGPGHHVAAVPVVPAGAYVAHVWLCQASVLVGTRWETREPAKLAGASRIVIRADDAPAETVHVDEQAGELEEAVHGQRWRYVNAYAPTPERARQLAEDTARRLTAEE